MINRIVLVGRLTRDPELRQTNSGTNICSFTIAVDNRTKNADGTKTTSFIPCVCFAPTADLVIKYTKKGALVGVEGRLTQRSYTRQDGTKASTFEVTCDSVQFLEPKSATQETEEVKFDDSPLTEEEESLAALDLPDDDLPF